jgi:hypothetical protein
MISDKLIDKHTNFLLCEYTFTKIFCNGKKKARD